MKNYITFLLWLIVSIGYSQNSNVYVELFNVNSSALNNGKIHYFSNVGDTSINFSVVIGRNIGHVGNPTQVLALAVFDNNGLEYAASDTIALTQANFTAFDGTATPFINTSFTLKENKKEGVLKFKYRFRINGGGYDDWTNWFYATKTYQTKKYQPPIPATIIDGPDAICNEGIYTITYPYAISLANADAMATLTSLGNNQWKVERIGNASGTIVLKSVDPNGTITSKSISVGGMSNPEIAGPNIPNAGSFTYTINGIFDIENATVTWDVSSTTNNVSITTLSNRMATVNVSNWRNIGTNMIILTAQITTICGETITLTRTLGAGPGGPIEET